MKLRNLFLLSVIVTLSFAFAACDDGEKKTNPCGNSVLDPGEECDGTNLDGQTCSIVVPSRPGGTLACTPTCTFDTALCVAPSCENDVREGSEECDGTDLDGKTCADIDGFKSGTLACNAACTFNTDACVVDCVVDASFEDCNTMGGANECCPVNGMASVCSADFSTPLCIQTCDGHEDCGFSMICSTQISGCYYSYCGAGSSSTALTEPCLLSAGRPGTCYPLWRAMDDAGICFENGTLEHGDVCPLGDDTMGVLDVDPATQCANGFCFGPENATEGNCFGVCDAMAAYDDKTDTCPAGSTCFNFASIILDPNYPNTTTPNPNYLFREPDFGVCYIYEEAEPLYSCDLLTGFQINGPNPGSLCPDGQTCNYFALGSLLGLCYDVIETPKAVGDECTMASNAPQECGDGLQCFYDNPLNADTQSCLRICEAPANGALDNATANEACADLVDENDAPYVCMTLSRFFTTNGGLPTTGGTLPEKETSPTPLGFCMPIAATTVAQ